MEEDQGLSYRDAGVDIDAADAAVKGIKNFIHKTFDDNVLCDIGTFGAMYRFDPAGMKQPVLISSVDGVGTKLKLAFMTGKHDTVGIDLVSHCVNDILVHGARPIFFLDYLACGVLKPEVVADVVLGVAKGCRYAGCALIGGETAEMPDMYRDGEYDLAGTIVGVVDRPKIIDGSGVKAGHVVIGLPSSGLHTNGYSLARKICFDVAGLSCEDEMPYTHRSVREMLLEPHRGYAKVIQLLLWAVRVEGMCHVTGGGITDNLPRTLPKGLGAEIDIEAWETLPVFRFLQEQGRVADHEMLRTFNMGMGYLVIVPPEEVDEALDTLSQASEEAAVIGRIIAGEKKVIYLGRPRYGPSH